MSLPPNPIFELQKRTQSQIIGLNDEIYLLGKTSSENYYYSPRDGQVPLTHITSIARLEDFYKTKFSKEIKDWQKKEKEKFKKIMHVPDYSENEHQLLNFIVREILPEFGICSYQPEIKVEVKEEKKKGTIWGKMVDKVTPFGKYPEKISEEEGRGLRGPKGKAEIIKNFSIWGSRVFPLIEEENAPPEIDENIYIKFEGKKYFYLTPVLASEINNLYQSSMEMEFKSEIFKELKAGTLEEFKILKDIVGEFNSIHKDRRIDKSEKGYTISIDTYPAYVMFCTKHKTYYLFPKATIGLTIDWQGQSSGPRVINPQNYQHPYVFSDGKICYGSFESYIPLDRPGIRIAKYLLLGRDCLMTSPIDGIDEANPYHERFQKISKEERAEKRIPITNFKNVWMENEF